MLFTADLLIAACYCSLSSLLFSRIWRTKVWWNFW